MANNSLRAYRSRHPVVVPNDFFPAKTGYGFNSILTSAERKDAGQEDASTTKLLRIITPKSPTPTKGRHKKEGWTSWISSAVAKTGTVFERVEPSKKKLNIQNMYVCTVDIGGTIIPVAVRISAERLAKAGDVLATLGLKALTTTEKAVWFPDQIAIPHARKLFSFSVPGNDGATENTMSFPISHDKIKTLKDEWTLTTGASYDTGD